MRVEILKAVVGRLKEGAPEGMHVYTHVLANSNYPYFTVEVEDVSEGGIDLPSLRRYCTTLQVQAWSRQPHAGEIAQMAAHIRKQLIDQTFACGEGASLSLQLIKEGSKILNDGITRIHTVSLKGGVKA